METSVFNTVNFQNWFARWQQGDTEGRDLIIRHSQQRFERLVRKMLRGEDRLRRWEQTGDVLVNAQMRLLRALEHVAATSTKDFFGLAALEIRRELCDLARRYYGPEGWGRHHARGDIQGEADSGPGPAIEQAPAQSPEEDWLVQQEVLAAVDQLAADERAAVDCVFFQGLTLTESGELLGISHTAVRKRLNRALLKLRTTFDGADLQSLAQEKAHGR